MEQVATHGTTPIVPILKVTLKVTSKVTPKVTPKVTHLNQQGPDLVTSREEI